MPRAVANRPQPLNDEPQRDTLESLKASLQRTFGRSDGTEKKAHAPRESEAWLRPPRFGLAELLASACGSLVIELRDGSVWVGDVRAVTRRTVWLAPWGCVGERLPFDRTDIVAAERPRPHSWAAERSVRERQRRGDPGCVRPKKLPPPET